VFTTDDPEPVPTRSFVTGATGLLGSRIVEQLLAGGGEVTALVRDRRRAAALLPDHPGLTVVTGDITELDSYRDHLRGKAAVFHTAAYFREYFQPGPDLDQLDRVNVQAVEELLLASAAAGIPVVVHTSSTTVLERRPGRVIDEDSRPARDQPPNAYRDSKVRAETVVARCVERTGLRVPLVLPGWMWGPGDAGPTAAGRLFLAVGRGELRAVPSAGNHIVDARDVAGACLRAAAHGSSGRRYVVAGHWHPLAIVCAEIATVCDRPLPRVVPVWATLAFTTVLEWQARLRGRLPIATRVGVRTLVEGDQVRYSSARAERELGVGFRPLAQTIGDEAAWYRDHGFLPPSINDATQPRKEPTHGPQ
jgi:dihydroflavonol-4-reductase